jgi:RimJ/RimL family protein N-acetyltransferase
MAAHAFAFVSGARGWGGRLDELRTRFAGRWQLGLYARLTRYGLLRDLKHNFPAPGAKIPLAVRPLDEGDLSALFGHVGAATERAERLEVAWRHAFVEKGARGGFVAIDERSNTPCYVQWLLCPRDNAFIKKIGGFPPLAADEVLLENAYTPPAYRGLGVMSAAMARLAERARDDFGATKALFFAPTDNIASLKGSQRAGFHPYLLHRRTRLGFGLVSRDTFETLAESDPRRRLKF